MRDKISSIGLAALLVATAVLSGAAAAASTTTTIDADHPLASQDAITEFENSGYVNASLSRVQVNLAVSDTAAKISGYDPLTDDIGSTYLVVEYDEEIDRTLRIYIPDDYFHPITKQAQCAGSSETATLRPINGGNRTEVKLSVTGPTRCIIEINAYRSGTYTILERVEQRVKRVAGVGIPLIGGESGYQWKYRSSSAFGSNSVLRIDGVQARDAVIQYKSNATGEWIPVPDSKSDSAPVYRMVKSGDKDTVWVVADGDPTRVRFKPAGGRTLGGIISDIASIPERVGIPLPDIAWGLPWGSGDSGEKTPTNSTTSSTNTTSSNDNGGGLIPWI